MGAQFVLFLISHRRPSPRVLPHPLPANSAIRPPFAQAMHDEALRPVERSPGGADYTKKKQNLEARAQGRNGGDRNGGGGGGKRPRSVGSPENVGSLRDAGSSPAGATALLRAASRAKTGPLTSARSCGAQPHSPPAALVPAGPAGASGLLRAPLLGEAGPREAGPVASACCLARSSEAQAQPPQPAAAAPTGGGAREKGGVLFV